MSTTSRQMYLDKDEHVRCPGCGFTYKPKSLDFGNTNCMEPGCNAEYDQARNIVKMAPLTFKALKICKGK